MKPINPLTHMPPSADAALVVQQAVSMATDAQAKAQQAAQAALLQKQRADAATALAVNAKADASGANALSGQIANGAKAMQKAHKLEIERLERAVKRLRDTLADSLELVAYNACAVGPCCAPHAIAIVDAVRALELQAPERVTQAMKLLANACDRCNERYNLEQAREGSHFMLPPHLVELERRNLRGEK